MNKRKGVISQYEADKVAEMCHISWAGWMKYLFSKSKRLPFGYVLIPPWAVERWTRQMNTRFDELPQSEQKSDYTEAEKYICLFDDMRG